MWIRKHKLDEMLKQAELYKKEIKELQEARQRLAGEISRLRGQLREQNEADMVYAAVQVLRRDALGQDVTDAHMKLKGAQDRYASDWAQQRIDSLTRMWGRLYGF